jgi:hypothetical protein
MATIFKNSAIEGALGEGVGNIYAAQSPDTLIASITAADLQSAGFIVGDSILFTDSASITALYIVGASFTLFKYDLTAV